MNLYTSNELIQIVIANNDRLKRGILVIRLDPKRIKSENSILLVVMPVIKEFNDRDFFKFSPTIKCYNCQEYGHVVANCPSPKIAINDKVFIEASKPVSAISPKVTPVIKEFNIVPLAATAIVPFVAATTVVRPFPRLYC